MWKQSVALVVIYAVLLAVVNIFGRGLAIPFCFVSGFIIVLRIFFAPGVITWRRDVALFSTIVVVLGSA
jgi:hypothetical protein